MNILMSCIGKRGYIADYFRSSLPAGSRIYGTSNNPATSGFSACDEGILMPDIVSDEYCSRVLSVCREKRADGLLSFLDLDVMTLAPLRERILAQGTIPLLPTAQQATIAFDKLATYQFLTEANVPTPTTFGDLRAAVAALKTGSVRFPLYVKPRFGFGSRNTFRVMDVDQLRVFFGLEPDMIIQEALTGEAYNIDACNSLAGEPLSVVPWRRVLSRMGETEHAVTCEYPELLDFGVYLSRLLGHAGPMDADLYISGDEISVLEVNLRFGGGYPVSHLAGADFPRLIVQMLRGEQPGPCLGAYERNISMMKRLMPFGGPTESMQRQSLHIRGPADERKESDD